MTTLADRVVTVRAHRALSQRALAKAAGISRSYLCDIEKGRGDNPTTAIVERIAAALAVSPVELLSDLSDDERSREIRAVAGDLYALLSEGHRLVRRLEALGLS